MIWTVKSNNCCLLRQCRNCEKDSIIFTFTHLSFCNSQMKSTDTWIWLGFYLYCPTKLCRFTAGKVNNTLKLKNSKKKTPQARRDTGLDRFCEIFQFLSVYRNIVFVKEKTDTSSPESRNLSVRYDKSLNRITDLKASRLSEQMYIGLYNQK